MTELSDELLVAYVDGQLARKQTRAVEKVLDQDDVIAARVELLKAAHDRLEAAFEAILAGEEAEVSAVSAPQGEGIWISWRAVKIAAAVIGIALALALAAAGYGWPLKIPGLTLSQESGVVPPVTETVASDWRQDAAHAHALLSRESLEVSLESQGSPDFVAFELTKAFGSNLKLPSFEPQGFKFVRAQLLRSGGAPLAQVLYLGAKGAPLALYAKKGEGPETLTFLQYGPVATVTWAEDGIAYLLAGEAEEPLLMRLATKAKLEPLPPPRTAPKPHTPVNSALEDDR